MRNQKGITLVALVVTIVVLLILAGVSIAMLSGEDGIITNAQRAKAANTEGEIYDNAKMAYNTVKTEIIAKSAVDSTYSVQAAATEGELVNSFLKEMGITGTVTGGTSSTVTDGGFTAKYTASVTTEGSEANGTVEVTYTDSTFDGEPYNEIVITLTLEADDVSLSSYTMQTL